MDKNKVWYYEKLSSKVLQSLKKNTIEAFYCKTGNEAREKGRVTVILVGES